MISMEFEGYDELIRTLDRIDDTLTGKALREAVVDAARVVVNRARQLCPAPGYRGDKPQWGANNPENRNVAGALKPLRDTIGMEVRSYGVRQLALAGPYYPAGAHGHLVEYGHRLIVHGKERGYVAGRPFMRPAFDETKGEQLAAMQQRLASTLQQLTG